MKKLLAMLLALVMVLSLAACGEQTVETEAPTKAPETDAPAGETEAPTQAPTETEKTLADYPKVDSFTAYVTNGGIDDEAFNAQPLAQKIKDVTGYDVKFIQLPKSDVDTTVTNIFTLGEDVQYVFVTKSQFNDLMAQGALAPITEYVNASTNLKEVISEIGWGSATGEDGEIYGIPNSDPRECTSKGFYFRLDWLKEYNAANPGAEIAVPSEENGYSMSVSNFEKMLQYFDTKVEGGNALIIEVDPNSSDYTEDKPVYLQTILPAFGINSEWADVNGTLTYIVEQDGFAEYMEYMEGLFDQGLITYQATKDDTNAVNSLMNDMAGVALVSHTKPYSLETSRYEKMTGKTLTDEEKQTFTDTEYTGYIAALVADENEGDASAVRVWSKKVYNQYIVCPYWNTEEQNAAVVDYCDKKLDKDVFLSITIGVEGESFEYKDGGYYPILPAFNDTYNLADKFLSGTREADYAEYWLARTRKTAAQGRMFGMINYNIDGTGIMDPRYMMPSNEVIETEYADARNAVVEKLILTVFDSSAEFNYDEIAALWESNSGSDIENAINEWYATWEYKDTYNDVQPVK